VAARPAALSLAASATSAGPVVTIGQIDPGSPVATCIEDFDSLQPTVTSGNPYVVPYTGMITTRLNASTFSCDIAYAVSRREGSPL
jgi:hypothetical protein